MVIILSNLLYINKNYQKLTIFYDNLQFCTILKTKTLTSSFGEIANIPSLFKLFHFASSTVDFPSFISTYFPPPFTKFEPIFSAFPLTNSFIFRHPNAKFPATQIFPTFTTNLLINQIIQVPLSTPFRQVPTAYYPSMKLVFKALLLRVRISTMGLLSVSGQWVELE